MRLVGLTMPIEAIGFAFMHGLLGAGDAKSVMFVSIGTQWLLFLPLAYFLGPVLGFGLFTVWLLQGGSRALQSVLFLSLWHGSQMATYRCVNSRQELIHGRNRICNARIGHHCARIFLARPGWSAAVTCWPG